MLVQEGGIDPELHDVGLNPGLALETHEALSVDLVLSVASRLKVLVALHLHGEDHGSKQIGAFGRNAVSFVAKHILEVCCHLGSNKLVSSVSVHGRLQVTLENGAWDMLLASELVVRDAIKSNDREQATLGTVHVLDLVPVGFGAAR